MPATTVSKISLCTKSRVPAMQFCPWRKKQALAAPGITLSKSASGNTTTGFLPPSSRVTRFKFPIDAATIFLPTSVDPVKAILSTLV